MKASPAIFLCLLSALAEFAWAAPDLSVTKLYGKWTGDPASNLLGGAAAVSDQWIALGAASADEEVSGQGAVQVFAAATGAFVRKLLPPSQVLNQAFGASVELSGDLLVVGAPASGSAGKAYLFNVKTGALIRTLTPSTSASNDGFGRSLSIDGDLLAIGADGGTQRVWLFRLSTGQELGSATPADPQAGALFGYRIDLEGGLLLAGAPQYDNAGADRGAVYWYNVTNPALPQQLSRTLIPGTDASDFCGISVKLHQGFGIVGCPGMNANVGRVVVLDARAGVAGATVSKTLSATGVSSFGIDVDASDGLIAATDLGGTIALFDLSGSSTTSLREFPVPGFVQASSLALSGNTLLLGNQSDAAQGSAAGAGIVLRNLTRPLPLQKVTAKGDFAPGAPETGFASFSDVRLSDDGSLAIAGGLSGPGSGGGKDTGVWETLGGSSLTLASKSRNVVGGSTLSAVGAPLMKASFTLAVPATTIPGTVIYRAKLDGTKPALLRDNGTSVAVAFAAGQAVDGSELLSLGAAAVPTLDNSLAFAGKFKLSGATTAANDSALIWHRFSHPSVPPIASATETIREGDASGFSAEPGEASPPTIGEIALPMALTGTRLFSIHQLTGPADKNQGLIGRSSISGALEALFRKGVSHPPNATGAAQASLLFGSFLGVSSDPLNRFMFRAQLTGDGVTAANNEGLWGASGGSVKQIIRKGDLLPGSATASISGFKAFWVANGQFMVWVTLKGTGVTAANDQAVVLFQTSAPVADVPVVLLREGDFAPGLSPAKIGTIQQIEVDGMQGQYLILAGLTGAPGKDLALFRGHSKAPLGSASEQPIRLPYPILRKGIWFDDQPSKLKSFSLPTNTRGTSGAGNIGLGTVLQATAPSTSSRIVSLLTFENGVTQAGAGAP